MSSKIKAIRYHDFSMGHRVVGHEGACKNLHGHNYRIYFHCEAERLDSVGRVIDFSCIKEKLCMWLENMWDHCMLIYKDDPWLDALEKVDSTVMSVPFNPTAENIGEHLLHVVAPIQLQSTGITCTQIVIEETRKCSVSVELI